MSVRLAIDIGGTFTDATLIDEETGDVSIAKVLTTPADPSEGFMQAAERALAEGERRGGRGHASSSTPRRSPRTRSSRARSRAAASSRPTGFRDLLEIQRQVRPTLYDTQFEKAKPLVPRDRAVVVGERLGPKGEVLRPLEDASVRDAAAMLRREEVESVAVCLLHAYVNPEHERRVGEILAEELPGVPISLSSEVAPEFREYLRASTTVINAVIRPVVQRYLQGIESRLADAGVRAKLLVMQSSGGIFGSDAAAVRPVFMVESGPAAGVIASAYLGETLGRRDILSFDMGGTTAKVGLIQDGRPSVTKDYNVGGHAGAGIGGMSLSGYPVRTPVVDLVEIGAGGGSIAWVDSGGLLRVGPQSAGADPGPVCYRRGGVEPTVTDANVVLGRLNPGYFLGGEIGLDVDGAARAIEERCAKPLGLSVTEAANGIVEIANAAMVNALHLISVQRGYDPRDFVLVGFGGAGPVHANALARDAEMPTLLIPRSPGIFSATGLLTTDLKRDTALTIMRRLDDLDASEVEATFARLEEPGAAELEAEGIGGDAIEFLRQVDLRYVGQSFELTIPAGDEAARALPRRARAHVRVRRPRRAGRGGEPEADERRPDREAAAATARGGRPAGAEGAPARLLRRGGRLRRLPDLRPLRAARRGAALAGPGRRGGVRLDHGRPPRVRRRRGRDREPDHREGGSVSAAYGIVVGEGRDGADAGRRPARVDIYRPARDGDRRRPVPDDHLRTPYDKTDKRYTEIADFFVPRGYNVVLQDLRDRYNSEGPATTSTPPRRTPGGTATTRRVDRGAAVVATAGSGTVGSSYGAITQVRTALEAPPHLTAIWPDVVPTNSFQNQCREGGAMQGHMFWALFIHAQDAQDVRDDPAKPEEVWDDLRDLRRLFRATPWQRGQTALRHVPPLEQTLIDYYTRGAYDEYWARIENDYTHYWDQHADIPGDVLDRLVRPVSRRRRRVLRRDGGAEHGAAAARDRPLEPRRHARRRHLLPRGRLRAGQRLGGAAVLRGAARVLPPLAARRRDRPARGRGAGAHLRDGRRHGPQDRGGQARPRRRLARGVGVAARARASDAYYLHGDGSLSTSAPAAAAAPRRFTFDPAHPVPTIGGLYCSIGELPAGGAGMEQAWARFLSPVLRLRDLLTPGPADQKESPAFFGSRSPTRGCPHGRTCSSSRPSPSPSRSR